MLAAQAPDINMFRPGLTIKITGAEIASDGAIRVRVRLTDPKGEPLDRLGVTSPGTVSVSFIAAYIPKGQSQYVSYTTRVQNSAITGASAIQASGENNGVFQSTGAGEYSYTFRARAPQSIDRTAVHTIGAYGSRNLSEFDMRTQYDDDVFHFVPDGSAVTGVRDVIRTASCNKCHHDMAFHGGSRKTMEVCVLCHTPQTVDPDTGNTVDMPVMTHRIHMGANLPSVEAGRPYKIIGNAGSVHDYSKIVFPPDARSCGSCHEAGAAQAQNVFKANRAACGACHDDVNFDTGEGHLDMPQRSDALCANCHFPQGEYDFDSSIRGAHTVPRLSGMLPGVVFELLAVDGAAPGKRPTVTFSLKDKSGRPMLPAQMRSLSLILTGPNSDFSTYVSEDVRKAEGPGDGRYYWTFINPLPENASGSWTVGIEGRRDAVLLAGTKAEMTVRESGVNRTIAFSVDDSPVQKRRQVVATEKCNACHGSLTFHGDNRNTVEQCVICHNPTKVSGGSAPAAIDFRVMIHRLHTGRDLERPYAVGSHSYENVGYPGDRRNCAACHVNGSEQLPVAGNLLPVADPAGPVKQLPPTTAACTGCHSGISVLAHAMVNTSASQGESCAVCHGQTSDRSVTRAHGR